MASDPGVAGKQAIRPVAEPDGGLSARPFARTLHYEVPAARVIPLLVMVTGAEH